ncbi:uncharacterized protein LODBEIA_P02960 [Lodderomyces beijingensis]|uniref:Nucleolar pre-ribosomal-associated protein 1 n=1 Tax=Lodderomyces beijingensis TaxID=1775926 RepID=A0ABP0ZD26_9ASCO
MSEPKRRKVYSSPSVNVDHHVIEELDNVLASLEDTTPKLSLFIERGYLGKLLPIWSFYSATSNHKEFVSITNKINAILYKLNELKGDILFSAQNRQILLDAYKDILINYSKVIYRALSSLKPSSTNPTIRLLENLVNYDAAIAVEFLNNFDLTLPVLPKLVTPSKIEIDSGEINDAYSIRSNFVKFWISLCSSVSHVHRLDLLTNHSKIVRNIWKYLQYDTAPSIQRLIEFLDQKVLDESHFKKSQKCKILNDNFMFKVHDLFNRIKEPYFIKFMDKLTTDTKNGLIFINDEFWNKHSDVGVVIAINNKNFKVANKLLYTLLTTLKPTDSNQQLQFIVRVLSSCQELIAPYMNYLVQHGGGYHSPSLTSWWITYTLLYTNVLQIPNPVPSIDSNVELVGDLDAGLIAESIAFAPLSKSALTAGLQPQKKLIVQLTLQLILYMLTRLENVSSKVAVAVRQNLIDAVTVQLPDISIVMQVLSNNEVSQVTRLTALKVANKYECLTPSSTSKSSLQKLVSTGVSSIIEKQSQSLTSLDLILLDLYMQLQNQDFKWWNKINDQNSFFTSLLKVVASSSKISSTSLVAKIYNLLNKLSEDKMLFNEKLLVTPLMALIRSIDVNDGRDGDGGARMGPEYWNMLDETVARCVRTPYKYLDLSHAEYNDTSIFVVSLVEQFGFMVKNNVNVDTDFYFDWLYRFLRYLMIFGGSEQALSSLAKQAKEGFLDIMNPPLLHNTLDAKEISIPEIVYSFPVKDLIRKPSILEKKKMLLSNPDYVATLTLARLVVEHSQPVQPAQQLLTAIFNKVWSYLTSSDIASTIYYFASDVVWRPLFASDNENGALALQLYNGILENFPEAVNKEFRNYIKAGLQNGEKKFIAFVWTVDDTDLSTLLDQSTGDMFIALASHAIHKRVQLTFEQVEKLMKSTDAQRDGLISNAFEQCLVSFSDRAQMKYIFDKIIRNPADYFLIPFLIKKIGNEVDNLLQGQVLPANDNLRFLIASSMMNQNIPVPSDILDRCMTTIMNKLTKGEVESSQWKPIITILASSAAAEEHVSRVLQLIDFKHTTTNEFIELISKLNPTVAGELGIWLQKCMFYVTKKIAESDSLSENFEKFITKIGDYILKHNMWSFAPANILNTQLEVILSSKWAKKSVYLQYVVKLILSAPKNKIDFQKSFQIAVTSLSVFDELPSEDNKQARFYAAAIVFFLFNFDHSKMSNLSNLDVVLQKFQGLNRAEDVLLKFILQKMEAKSATSWITRVAEWEFSGQVNEDEKGLTKAEKLITKNNNNGQITVNLNKEIIANTLSSKRFANPDFHSGKTRAAAETWRQVQDYESENSLIAIDRPAYDHEFLLMVILNNEELLKLEKEEKEDSSVTHSYTFNLKNLVDSGLLEFIIANLADKDTLGISKVILNKVLMSIDNGKINNSYKDKNVFKVFLSSILFTLASQHDQVLKTQKLVIGPMIWYLYSQLVPILANPGHFLYEKTFRFVLSHPKLSSWDIPLWNAIVSPQPDASQWYFRELTWIIENIAQGLSTTSDLSILKQKQIETILNLLNSKYLNMKLKTAILKFVYKIQEIDQGSDLLVTRFGLLTDLALTTEETKHSESETDVLFNRQLKNNVDSILCRLEIGVGSSERVVNWTGGVLKKELQKVHATSF